VKEYQNLLDLKKEMDKIAQSIAPEFIIMLVVIIFVAILITCLVWVVR